MIRINVATLIGEFKSLEVQNKPQQVALDTFFSDLADIKKNFGNYKSEVREINFLEKCSQLIEKAQKSPLKNHIEAKNILQVLIQVLIQAINAASSRFLGGKPLLKTETYNKLTLFKERIQDAKSDLEAVQNPQEQAENSSNSLII